jgi:branched-subunit amino acid transport protein
MSVLLAVLVVGFGSLVFRVVPLLSPRHLPQWLTQGTAWAGMAVIAGISVRSVLLHEDTSIRFAPALAALAVLAGLVLAYRGRSVLAAVAVGVSAYLVGWVVLSVIR